MGVPKLSLDYRGTPLIRATWASILEVGADENLMVVSAYNQSLGGLLGDIPVRLVEAPPSGGIADSIAAGVRAARSDVDAILLALGDMPDVSRATICALAEAVDPASIVIPNYQGKFGNPVMFGRIFRAELEELAGDTGGRQVYERHPDTVKIVSVQDPGILRDVDVPLDLLK